MECAATLTIIGTVAHDYLPKCINQTTEYLKSAKDVDTYAKVNINKAGRRIIHATVSCWQEEGQNVALSHSRFLVGASWQIAVLKVFCQVQIWFYSTYNAAQQYFFSQSENQIV